MFYGEHQIYKSYDESDAEIRMYFYRIDRKLFNSQFIA